MAVAKKQKKTLDFDKGLVLFKYMLSLFSVKEFGELKLHFVSEDLERIDDNGRSAFIRKIAVEKLYNKSLTEHLLFKYDENIIKHTNRINEKRNKRISWKYFQYLTLLFTEIYLDRFFSDREKLLEDLNTFLAEFLKENDLGENTFSPYTINDLDKLAYWNATGSGKTLILHMNILQYNHYMNEYMDMKSLKEEKYKVNKIILLTPNEGLSLQHLHELHQSNIPADIFKDGTKFSNQREVEIIDIHKIKKDKSSSGGKTFDISSFGKNNLLLVDEGHRGSSGKEWKDIRNKISEEGFVFEYSATFGQAIKEEDKELTEEYSKSIIFDYSYKYFYRDHYGKDYSILNISEDKDDFKKQIYLIGSILCFYQQIKLFKNNDSFNKEFNIEKPLMLFVGSSVNSVRTEKGKPTSDVLDILLFLNYFVKNEKDVCSKLEAIFKGESGFHNSKGADIFVNRLSFINKDSKQIKDLYMDILKEVFNSNISGAELHIENIKKADGEIGIKFGDNEYFSLINIGDTSTFLKLCEGAGLHIGSNDYDETEFNKINHKNSPINILIGSKKFTEGWSSWRVSSIGLMNIGKSQGSQIIQLFGRGVRLKGWNSTLKRSKGLQNRDILIPDKIEILETLNIFGVKADYMTEFKKYLEDEKLPTEDVFETFKLPVIHNKNYNKKIKVLRVRGDLTYKKLENPLLKSTESIIDFRKSIQNRPVILDLYTSTENLESIKKDSIQQVKNEEKISKSSLELIDMDRVFFEIIDYKNQKSLWNLNISKDNIKEILGNNDWYTLFCQSHMVKLSINNLKKIENIVISLLKKYIDRYYNFLKSNWEKDKLVYDYLENSNSAKNLISEYVLEINQEEKEIIEYISNLEKELKDNKIKDFSNHTYKKVSGSYEITGMNEHLYNPIIHVAKKNNSIKVKPVHLNEGEITFVEALKGYLKDSNEEEVYLLRNQVGALGFFQEGYFYPDFILWRIKDGKQYINFIDPKGIREEGKNSSKIALHKTIKNYETLLATSDSEIVLNSFILSVTPYGQLEFNFEWTREEFTENHVFFINDSMSPNEKIESIKLMFENMK